MTIRLNGGVGLGLGFRSGLSIVAIGTGSGLSVASGSNAELGYGHLDMKSNPAMNEGSFMFGYL